MQYQPRTQTCW